MLWIIVAIVCAIVAAVAMRARQRWMTPWRNIEQIVDDIRNVRAPRTYLIEGSDEPRRVALALEEVFVRQRQLERENSEREFSVQTILGAMSDGLLIVDKAGTIRVANSSFRKMFGVGDDVIGTTAIESLRNVTIAQLVTRTLETGDVVNNAIALEDPPLELEVTGSTIRDNARELRGAVVLFRDVTRMKQTETMRRDFVANVSHELRTPLSIVHGYLEELRSEAVSAEDRLQIIEVMQKHSNRLKLLVEDLLSLAQLESAEPRVEFTDVDVRTFLPAMVGEWTERFEAKQLKHCIEIAADLPLVRADESRLQEVVYNLFDNAVKYSDAGGTIRIAAKAEGDRVQISVGNDGVGIPAADLPRVFERFYRVDKSRGRDVGGTGLGLSIVKHIVQLHGGSVDAQSTPADGTTIRVFLPVSKQLPTAHD